jgi:hypothetical protein
LEFSRLWRLSSIVYKETSFQSVFSLRTGGMLQQRSNETIKKLVSNAQVNAIISKILITVFIVFFGAVALYSPRTDPQSTIVGSASAFLAVVLALITLMGLQITTSFVSSKTTEVLSPLPLSKRDISTVVLLCFFRIFDLPLLTAIIAFPVLYAYLTGSILGGVASFLSVVVTEVFALSLTVGMARFFYSKIAHTGGRSKWKAFLRFVLMLVWVLPTFGLYFVIDFAAQTVRFFASFTQTLSTVSYLLALVYPFSYGYLISFTSHEVSSSLLAICIVSSLAYIALAGYLLRRLGTIVGRIGIGATVASRETVKDTKIKPGASWLGIIRKDVTIASRLPSYASLFVLPALQTIILAFTMSSMNAVGINSVLGILTGMSFLTLLIPTALFSIEGLASAYVRSLPLQKRTLIFPKTVLSTLMYLISLVTLFGVAVFLGKDSLSILTFGLIHVLSVAAASMLELILLANRYWKGGFAIGNMYSQLWTYVLILIPGLIVVFTPIALAIVVYLIAETLMLPIFLAVAISEFVAVTLFALHEK